MAAALTTLVTPVPAAVFRSNTWPNGVVPFELDGDLDENQERVARRAMDRWMAVANITFRPRELFDVAWVHFRRGIIPGANYVGTVGLDGVGYDLGERSVNITDWSDRTVLHEVGHILGFVHEQNRTDREEFIRIEWDNVLGFQLQFNYVEDPFSDAYGSYDFGSIMQYGACAFSLCSPPLGPGCAPSDENCRAITVLPPNDEEWQTRMGTNENLSAQDKLVMSFLYPESDWRFVNPGSFAGGTGTFLHPFSPVALAINDVPEDGTIWLLRPGGYPFTGTIFKATTLRAPLGGAVIGR